MAMAAANGTALPPSSTSGTDAITCYACRKSISGTSSYIKVGTVKFHTECFTCCQCGITLHGKKFWHKKEKFYCQADYEKLLPVCKKCNERISNGKMIGAMGAHYHPEHFTCTKCQSVLGTTFFNRDGQPYCQKCGGPLERCAHCGQEAKADEIIKASGKPYHEHCLACHHCLRPLAKSGSTIFRKDDHLYCQQDYQELFAHRCTSCGEPILNDCMAVNAEFYHGKCFRCVQCAVHLDKYLSIGGELRCSNHISASSMRVVCNVCREPVPVHTVVAAVGAKFHPDCFRCSFCQKQLDKISAKVRDKLICCQDCLITSSVSPSLPIKEDGFNRQVDARIRSILQPLPNDPIASPSLLSNSSDRHRARSSDPESISPTSSTEVAAAPKPTLSTSAPALTVSPPVSPSSKEKRRSSPRRLPKGHTMSITQGAPESNTEIKLEWKKGDMIGKGSFGKVYMGMLVTGELIAVKQIELTTMEDKARAAQLQTEINLMKKLKHPNIVALLGTEQDTTKLNILMEYVPGKSIDFLLESFGHFKEPTIKMYTAQLLSALEYMHRQDVIHRDIKGKNVLVDTFGNLKLADFGSAKQFENILAKEAPSIGYNYTPLWTAPEVLLGNYGRKVDIWSLGCVLIEMATATSPWAECNFDNPFRALYHIGNSNAVPKIPDWLSDVAKDFIRKCLTRSPDDRPDANDLMSHPFVTDMFANNEFEEQSEDEEPEKSSSSSRGSAGD